MDVITKEIKLGEEVCKKIKNVYFSDKKWSECYKEVANLFTNFKRNMKKFYNLESKNWTLEVLEKTISFSESDIKETMEQL